MNHNTCFFSFFSFFSLFVFFFLLCFLYSHFSLFFYCFHFWFSSFFFFCTLFFFPFLPFSLSFSWSPLSLWKTMVGFLFLKGKTNKRECNWIIIIIFVTIHFCCCFCIAIVSWDVLINLPHMCALLFDQNIIAGAFKPPCKISICLADGSTPKQVCCAAIHGWI